MKNIFIFLLIIATCTFCNTKKEIKEFDGKSKSFSLAMQSREKADKVLSLFDTINAPKLLYSIEDKDFLVIIKSDQKFSEYYVKKTSKGKISDVRLLDNIESMSELLIKAFDLEKYSSELIYDKRGIVSKIKYFVIIDEFGSRYGECGVLSFPFVHIDERLDWYCIMRLAEIVHSAEINWEGVKQLWFK